MVNSRKIKLSLIGLVCSSASLVMFSACTKETSLAEEINSSTPDGFEAPKTKKTATQIFHKSVGGPIKKEQGSEWIENYKKKNGKLFTYTIESSALNKLLNDPWAEGVVLYYGVDDNGNRHVLPIAIHGDGTLVKTASVASQNGEIEWDSAIRFIENYSGATRSHFFGSNSLNRLINEQKAKKIVGTSALDDDGEEQLLLSVAGVTDATLEYLDRSNPCPPHCNADQDIINSVKLN
jgi:hypothetical protein